MGTITLIDLLQLAFTLACIAVLLFLFLLHERNAAASEASARTAEPLIDDIRVSGNIDYWAEIYERNNFRNHGVSFDRFMANPRGYLQVFKFDVAPPSEEFRPLLPAQVAVKMRLQQAELEADEQAQLQARHLAQLERKYDSISNTGGRIVAPIRPLRVTHKWQTGGHQAHAKPV